MSPTGPGRGEPLGRTYTAAFLCAGLAKESHVTSHSGHGSSWLDPGGAVCHLFIARPASHPERGRDLEPVLARPLLFLAPARGLLPLAPSQALGADPPSSPVGLGLAQPGGVRASPVQSLHCMVLSPVPSPPPGASRVTCIYTQGRETGAALSVPLGAER